MYETLLCRESKTGKTKIVLNVTAQYQSTWKSIFNAFKWYELGRYCISKFGFRGWLAQLGDSYVASLIPLGSSHPEGEASDLWRHFALIPVQNTCAQVLAWLEFLGSLPIGSNFYFVLALWVLVKQAISLPVSFH